MRFKIHPDYNVYFHTTGNTTQTRVQYLSPEQFDQASKWQSIEPGRTVVIGDIEEELLKLFTNLSRPAINRATATRARPGGIFSSRAYEAVRDHLFRDAEEKAPRSHQGSKKIIYRDALPSQS